MTQVAEPITERAASAPGSVVPHWIDSARVAGTSGRRGPVFNPATGAVARTLVEQLEPDLIILDLVLPDEDGLVLCSVLKNMADVPILICSGTQRRRDAFLSLKLGADDFIAKPFDVYDLLARVEVLLRRAAQRHSGELSVSHGPIRIGELRK